MAMIQTSIRRILYDSICIDVHRNWYKSVSALKLTELNTHIQLVVYFDCESCSGSIFMVSNCFERVLLLLFIQVECRNISDVLKLLIITWFL